MDDTAFTREIKGQPTALRAVTDYYSSGEGKKALILAADTIQNAGKLVFTGMGTSWHAVLSVMHELVSVVPSCELWDAGELFHFGLDTMKDGTVLFAISQSGESAETRAVVKACAGKTRLSAW